MTNEQTLLLCDEHIHRSQPQTAHKFTVTTEAKFAETSGSIILYYINSPGCNYQINITTTHTWHERRMIMTWNRLGIICSHTSQRLVTHTFLNFPTTRAEVRLSSRMWNNPAFQLPSSGWICNVLPTNKRRTTLEFAVQPRKITKNLSGQINSVKHLSLRWLGCIIGTASTGLKSISTRLTMDDFIQLLVGRSALQVVKLKGSLHYYY